MSAVGNYEVVVIPFSYGDHNSMIDVLVNVPAPTGKVILSVSYTFSYGSYFGGTSQGIRDYPAGDGKSWNFFVKTNDKLEGNFLLVCAEMGC